MKKKIIETIYFLFLFTTPLVFSYVITHDLLKKEVASCIDSDLELSEDNSLSDTHQTHLEQIDDNSVDNHCGFQFSSFKSSFSYSFTHPREYTIYLGLNTPPPEYL